MVCTLTCGIALAFVVASLFIMFLTNKQLLIGNFMKMLNEEQKQIYKKIIMERAKNYIVGSILGVILGFVYLYLQKKRGTPQICAFVAIVFAVSYFYYYLAPKSDWMLPHLDREQALAWFDIYKTMSYKYHLGFALGLVGYTVLAFGICK